MPNPPYIKGIGQLVLDRYTAQDHFEGKQFRHKASQVDLDSPILFSTAIPPSTANNVNQAIIDIAGILNSGGLSGYNKIRVGGIDVTPSRSIINFVSGATVVDNPLTLSTDITISGGGSGITELTGDVIAGPGNGSQSTIIKYLSGFSI